MVDLSIDSALYHFKIERLGIHWWCDCRFCQNRHFLHGCPGVSDEDYDVVFNDGYCPVCGEEVSRDR